MALDQNVSYTPYSVTAETRRWISRDRDPRMEEDSFPITLKILPISMQP
jgi:hypothetical protein